MRKLFLLSSCILILIFLCSCTQIGTVDCGVFTERFNEVNNNLQIDKNKLAAEKKGNEIKYYYFFDNNNETEYMLTIYTDKESNELTKCTLCTLSATDISPEKIKELFTSMAYAYNQISKEKADNIFNKMKLNKEITYKKDKVEEEDFDKTTVSLVVNKAGMAITLSQTQKDK